MLHLQEYFFLKPWYGGRSKYCFTSFKKNTWMYLISLEVLGLYEVCFKDEYFKAFFFFHVQVLFAFYFVYPGM